MKKLFLLLLVNTSLIASIKSQTTYVPDDVFEQALIDQGYDDVLDDNVVTANIDTITHLNVVGDRTSNNNIKDLTGIESFTALKKLNCSKNQLTSLNLRNGNNSNFSKINALGNSRLRCIQVDNVKIAKKKTANGKYLEKLSITKIAG